MVLWIKDHKNYTSFTIMEELRPIKIEKNNLYGRISVVVDNKCMFLGVHCIHKLTTGHCIYNITQDTDNCPSHKIGIRNHMKFEQLEVIYCDCNGANKAGFEPGEGGRLRCSACGGFAV